MFFFLWWRINRLFGGGASQERRRDNVCVSFFVYALAVLFRLLFVRRGVSCRDGEEDIARVMMNKDGSYVSRLPGGKGGGVLGRSAESDECLRHK